MTVTLTKFNPKNFRRVRDGLSVLVRFRSRSCYLGYLTQFNCLSSSFIYNHTTQTKDKTLLFHSHIKRLAKNPHFMHFPYLTRHWSSPIFALQVRACSHRSKWRTQVCRIIAPCRFQATLRAVLILKDLYHLTAN